MNQLPRPHSSSMCSKNWTNLWSLITLNPHLLYILKFLSCKPTFLCGLPYPLLVKRKGKTKQSSSVVMEMGLFHGQFFDTKAVWGHVSLCLPWIWHNKISRPRKPVWLQTTVETCGYIHLCSLEESDQGVARALGAGTLHIRHCDQRQRELSMVRCDQHTAACCCFSSPEVMTA